MNFNGIDLTPYLRIKTISGRGMTGHELTTLAAPGMNGAHFQRKRLPARTLTIEADVRAANREELRNKIDELNGILDVIEPVPIVFPDEDKTYYGVPESTDQGDEYTFLHQGTLTIICPDPYKYGPETALGLTGQGTVVEIEGTADADPVFEMEVQEPVTLAMVSNGDQYQLIGEPADVDTEVVEGRRPLLEERGETLDTWETGTDIDGTVDGELSTDNDGITVPSYGPDTDSGWHGPALIKDIGSAQDFEVEMMLEGRTTETSQTFRIEFYLFDEGMNNLGKMAIVDNNLNVYRKKGEARIGDKENYAENYPIYSENYSYEWDFFYGMVRMRREGNEFKVYITRINNATKHVYNLKQTYVDSANEYAGRLKYVQIHIGKYADTPRAYGPKIHYIKANELFRTAEDQTPYVAYPGDIITFDHTTDELLLNGEDITEEKNFGGEYFKLPPGESTLATLPDGALDTVLKYRPKFK